MGTPDRSTPPPQGEGGTLGRSLEAVGGDAALHCEFRLTAPRHFLYPALLLLLAEEPRHGYPLVRRVRELGFGPVSRPNVYRALADLAQDGLLDSWSAEPDAGPNRNVYGLTVAGRRQLDEWIDVIAAERTALGHIVDRFDELPGPTIALGPVAGSDAGG